MKSLLVLDDVRLHQLRISLKCAPRTWRDQRLDEVRQIAARLTVLEQDQEGHCKKRHNKFHEEAQRHSQYLCISGDEVAEDVHHRCKRQHEDQVLEHQSKKRDLGVQVAMNGCQIKAHVCLLQFVLPQIPCACVTIDSAKRTIPETIRAPIAAMNLRIHVDPG